MIDALKRAFNTANMVLRSVYEVACREGKDTDWDMLKVRLKVVLMDQHYMLTGNRPLSGQEELEATRALQAYIKRAHYAAPVARPRIVCLCGSTRFYEEFKKQNFLKTMAGEIVLSVGFFHHAADKEHGESVGISPEEKIALDELHKRKIDLCDYVFVINVNGYIGDSTRSEIEYAYQNKKPIVYLDTEPKYCKESILHHPV